MVSLHLSRILFVLLLTNELLVLARSTPEERARLQLSPLAGLSTLLLVVPFFFVLPLPEWLGWLAVVLQGTGLLLEVFSELQLMRAQSFAVSDNAATQVQTDGAYRWLENPIYNGILLQLVGWALWMPVVFITVALYYGTLRGMVARERAHLATLGATHRGLDSFLWN